ncbi:MAG: acyltransferase family protein [Litorimonas sp.]
MMTTVSPSQIAKSSGGFRSDIQGLRAIAVGLVVIFHMFPLAVTGGYVGVDVFFVISGFLITGLLIRRAERDGRVDFKDFYIRRARRLLPAACLALIVTGLACLIILPKSLLQGVGKEILASAFYVENFFLYFQGRDYLTAETAPSPFQHYWSLSIEEQFYVVWPIAIAVGVWIAKRLKMSARGFLLALLTIITLVSLYLSATISPKNPGAYFLTSTRVWELALGGLLALGQPYIKLPNSLTLVLRWIGLVAILYAGITFTKNTVFPGTAALIPTLGTLALLLPRAIGPTDPTSLLSLRPMTYLGDISYSLYLWHWPILVLGAYVVGGTWTLWQLGLAFLLMIMFSHVSKYYIEDKLRHAGDGPRPGMRTLVLSTALLTGTAIVAMVLINPLKKDVPQTTSVDRGDFPGAYALAKNAAPYPAREFTPAASWAISDNPDIYADSCQVTADSDIPKPCFYGDPEAPVTIVLVGDSHAAHYLPALQTFALQNKVRIVTQTKSSCPFIDATTQASSGPYTTCRTWNTKVIQEIIDLKPDVVITAKFSSTTLSDVPEGLTNDQAVSEALARQWKALGRAGIPVVAIAYTPRFPGSVPDCVSTPGKPIVECNLDRATALSKFDHIQAAGQLYPQAIIADLNDNICQPDTCPAVVGNILVYRDAHHLTATYSRTLDTALGNYIRKAVKTEIGPIEPDTVSLDIDLPTDLLDLVPERASYPGALVLASKEQSQEITRAIRPSLDRLSRDFHLVFRNGCYGGGDGDELVSCTLGAENGDREIVIVGDNAAAMWLPALEPYAEMRGVKITTFLKSGCPFTSIPNLRKGQPNIDCVNWGEDVVQAVNQIQPDILLTASFATHIAANPDEGESGKSALARGITMRLSQIDTTKTKLVAMAQLPTQQNNLVECLKATKIDSEIWMTNASGLDVCNTARSEALRREDPMVSVAADLANVEYLDLTDMLCSQTSCPVIKGGILTYKDPGHVTATYMATLAPVLGMRLDEMLGFETP